MFHEHGDGETYQWLGDGDMIDIPAGSFKDRQLNATLIGEVDPDLEIFVRINNLLWSKDENGEYRFNSGETLLPGYVNYETIMAAITNFQSILQVLLMTIKTIPTTKSNFQP